MKFRNIFPTLASLLLCVGAASCTQDNIIDSGKGKMLPPDEFPLKFTATIDDMTSRAENTDPWVDKDEIAVQIDDYPAIGLYILNSDGSVMKSDAPLSWPYETGFVKAWYPYANAENLHIDDQSGGYHHIDFLKAETPQAKRYDEVVNLNFKHLMAKVSFNLVQGDGISDEEMATVKVRIGGYTNVNFKKGELTASYIDNNPENQWITHDTVNTVLVVPQAMTGKPLFKVNLTVNVNGHLIDKELVYKSDIDLEAGIHYNYTITVQKDRLKVNPPVSASWVDVGEAGEAKPWVFKVTFKDHLSIPKQSRKEMVFSGNVINVEEFRDSTVNYLEVAGNKFSISCTMYKGVTPKMHMWEGKSGIDEMTENSKIVGDGELFTFDFNLRSNDVILAYKEFAGHSTQPGDYYYSDGTWSSTLQSDKQCIAIVYKELEYKWWVDNSMMEALADIHDGGYDLNNFKDGMIHGYAVAIADIPGTFNWSSARQRINVGESSSRHPTQGVFYNGYSNMKIIESASIAYPKISFGILDACKTYQNKVETQYSSGWYLPSHDQFKAIIANKQIIQDRLNKLKDAGGADLAATPYWSSSEAAGTSTEGGAGEDENKAYCLQDWKKDNPSMKSVMKNQKYLYRAVLTF